MVSAWKSDWEPSRRVKCQERHRNCPRLRAGRSQVTTSISLSTQMASILHRKIRQYGIKTSMLRLSRLRVQRFPTTLYH
ncbi:hypothetical protein PAXRUDRAFT_232370 [Paxillus rubicundulus Ve08.2h10]|uniref:Uncharacterized protein n=1 Tax=Paxillus rubicundulus Ve08.2h10 TaxID=930991 RepID=A0A0D0DTP2_9AGAM|nr:hypothetical protein PAXRUDRAFT_232370 [Paxillus rubicundulus Ve08.2h10]